LAKPEKIAAVAELKERLQDNEIAILTKYVGINVANITQLRKELREAGIEFKVYKNNLAAIALNDLGLEGATQFMDGPTAWAFSKDPVAPAKILKETASRSKFVAMVGGILSGKVVTAQQLDALATLPPRDVLLAQVVGTIAAPLRNLGGTLNALPRNLANVLDQIRKQKEEGGAEAA
jgi:large subunit ribosomal protein L10